MTDVVMDLTAMPVADDTLFEYNARVGRKYDGVYDGDTIYLDIDCGLGIWKQDQPIRLVGVDAPEITGAEKQQGNLVKDFLKEKLLPGERVRVRTYKDRQSFTRYLGIIWRQDGEGNWLCVNQEINNWMANNLTPSEE